MHFLSYLCKLREGECAMVFTVERAVRAKFSFLAAGQESVLSGAMTKSDAHI